MLSIILLKFVDLLTQALAILIIVRVVASWVVRDPWSNGIVKMVYELTEPVLAPIRKMFPVGGLDFSPMIALILLQAIDYGAHYLFFRL